jgi:hypothetical protein
VDSSKSYESWKGIKIKGSFYYLYQSIPNQSPTHYRLQLPDEQTLRQMAKSGKRAAPTEGVKREIERAKTTEFARFMPQYAEFKPEQQTALAKAAAVVAAITEYIVANTVPLNKGWFWEELQRIFEADPVRYVPTNNRRLKDKFSEILRGGDVPTDSANVSDAPKSITQAVYLPRQHNTNAVRYDDPQVLGWLLQLRKLGRNQSNATIIRDVRELCIFHEKKVPSDGWFSAELADWQTKLLTKERHGDGVHGQRFRSPIRVETPDYVGDAWEVDGTRINLLSWKESETVVKDGQPKTVTREKHLFAVVLFEVRSQYPLGWAFGLNEDHKMYQEALEMAVETAGYLPYELVYDRFPGHDSEGWQTTKRRLIQAGVKVTMTSNAEGKPHIERWISTLQACFMDRSPFYYGEGVKSRRSYAHRETAWLSKRKKDAHRDGWSAAKAIQETERIFEAFSTTPFSEWSKKYKAIKRSPKAVHDDSLKPNGIVPPAHQTALIVGESKRLQVYGNGLLQTIIDGRDYQFDIADEQVWLTHPSVLMVFYPDDLQKVWVFEVETERYLGEAFLVEKAKRYGPDADLSTLGKRRSEVNRRENVVKERFAAKVATVTEDFVEDTFLLIGKVGKHDAEANETAFLNTQYAVLNTPDATDEQFIETEDKTTVSPPESKGFDPKAWARNQY